MKNKINYLIYIISVSLISLIIAVFLLNDFILPIVFASLNGLFAYLLYKENIKNKDLYKKIDSSYEFVNLMNIQMLSTNSVYEAYKSIEMYLSDDFSNINSEEFLNQLNEIANDYNLNGFKMYVNSINIYDENGGYYKELQKIPTSICQKTKVYYHKLYNSKQIKIVEIISLYLLWFCVLVFLKISIPDFYKLMISNYLYKLLIFALLVIGCLTLFLAIKEFFKNKIRGL